ncbi:hypothetical protein NECAME_04656 [Necator americanus]|uniref:Uncharacterized protein n=1 Tax=Necator americanus TaxID=51031 RepID=W2SNZ6_NECAM|nr:hypothetical protein NECAME_04656 [Necator americanus]ETN71360.1 hypothetical protein NECAME_04656 [Necator americanus]
MFLDVFATPGIKYNNDFNLFFVFGSLILLKLCPKEDKESIIYPVILEKN